MKCKYKESCGYEYCLGDCCPEYEAAIETNADKIRAMTDEELALSLMEACIGREICAGCPAQECSPKCPGESYGAWVEWFKKPAEGDGNG